MSIASNTASVAVTAASKLLPTGISQSLDGRVTQLYLFGVAVIHTPVAFWFAPNYVTTSIFGTTCRVLVTSSKAVSESGPSSAKNT